MRIILVLLISLFAQSTLVASAQSDDMSRLRWGASSAVGLQAGIAGPSKVGFKPRMAQSSPNGLKSFNADDVFTVVVRNIGVSPITLCAPPGIRLDAVDSRGVQLHTLGTGGLILGGAFGYKEVIEPGKDWQPPRKSSVLYVTEHSPTAGNYAIRAHIDLEVCAPDRSHPKDLELESDAVTVSLG